MSEALTKPQVYITEFRDLFFRKWYSVKVLQTVMQPTFTEHLVGYYATKAEAEAAGNGVAAQLAQPKDSK